MREQKAAKKSGKVAPESKTSSAGADEGFAEDKQMREADELEKGSTASITVAAIAKPQNVRRASLTEEEFHTFEHAYGSARTPPLDGGEQGDAESDFLAGGESDTPSEGWESDDGKEIPRIQSSATSKASGVTSN